MPIAPLPANTVQTIGSSQVLIDSCSVVKELIDNSLDAGATAIFVELSLNALDIIQVKDNGSGIDPEDRCMLGKRHCTSKIRGLLDLEALGGTSLGFRGEALASAAELSGSLIVSTRIEGEATAVSLTIGRKGELTKEEHLSSPVGTTVRIENFLKPIPVRRQNALKSASKLLPRIKKLLQSYAFARPSVRFSLKFLKAKNENGNWIYAPKAYDYIPEAARKIFGKDVFGQCHWKKWQPSQTDDEILTRLDDAALAEGSYTIEALLPKPKYDPQVVSNVGQFISVDSRPVSCTRGTFKRIVGLYKSYLGSGSLIKNPDKPKDAILCMNITCPRASYDVNIEPAKDDVLFAHVDLVLRMVEDFFKDIYGEIWTKEIKRTVASASETKPRGIEALLAKRKQPPAVTPDQAFHGVDSTYGNEASINAGSPVTGLKPSYTTRDRLSNPISDRTKLGSVIKVVGGRDHSLHPGQQDLQELPGDIGSAEEYASFTNREIRRLGPHRELDDTLSSPTWANRQSNDVRDGDEEEGLRDISISNPWTIAKLTTPTRQHGIHRGINNQLLTPGYQTGELDDLIANREPQHEKRIQFNRRGLLTPQHTQSHRRDFTSHQYSSPEAYHFPSKTSGGAPQNTNSSHHVLHERPTHGCRAIDRWIKKSADKARNVPYSNAVDGSEQQDEEMLQPRIRDFASARTIPVDGCHDFFHQAETDLARRLSPPDQLSSESLMQSVSRVDDTQDLWLEAGLDECSPRPFPSARLDCDRGPMPPSVSAEDGNNICSPNPSISSNIPSSVHPDLAKALDYEVRKQAAVRQWRAKQSPRELENGPSQASQQEMPGRSISSPHQNRYRRALAQLRDPVGNVEATSAPALDYNDPRAHLIRIQAPNVSGGSSSAPRKRRKTSSLPFEKVREESTARDLILNIDTNTLDFCKIVRGCTSSGEQRCDTYLTSGMNSAAFSDPGLTIDTTRAWEATVKKLVNMSYQSNGNIDGISPIDLRIDLWLSLQTHLAAFV